MRKFLFIGFLVFLSMLVFAESVYGLPGGSGDYSIFFAGCDNDNLCDSGEDKCTCPEDCGECIGSVSGYLCQEYTCKTGLCRATTVYNCCGNHVCEVGENFANCNNDCPPSQVSIEVLSPEPGGEYLKGDSILFKARVKADGVIARQANVKVDTVTGTLFLYDDGNHGDVRNNDGIYANSLVIGESIQKGSYDAVITADKLGVVDSETISLNITAALELSLNLDRNSFLLGEVVDFNGFLKKRGQPLRVPVIFSASIAGTKLFDENVLPDSNGFYSFSYHSSHSQPEGIWLLRLQAVDSQQNQGLVEREVVFSLTSSSTYFDIKILSPVKGIFERGQEIRLLAEVFFDNAPLSGAMVEVSLPDSTVRRLEGIGGGVYSLEWEVPLDLGMGKQSVFVTAKKDINLATFTGSSESSFTVTKAPIEAELVSPKESIFGLAERIDFIVRLKYSNGEPVLDAVVVILVGGEKLEVVEKSPGLYQAGFVSSDASSLKETALEVSVFATDKFDNQTIERIEKHIEIRTDLSLDYYLRKEPLLFVSIIFGVFFALLVFFIFRRKKGNIRSLQKRSRELESLKRELQDKYFNRGAMSSDEYYNLLSHYTSELREVNASIDALGRKKKAAAKKPSKNESKASLFRVSGKSGNLGQKDSEFTGLFKVSGQKTKLKKKEGK